MCVCVCVCVQAFKVINEWDVFRNYTENVVEYLHSVSGVYSLMCGGRLLPFLHSFNRIISLHTILNPSPQLFPSLLARGSHQSTSLAPPPANHWTLVLVRIKTDGSGFIPYIYVTTKSGIRVPWHHNS